MGDYFNGRRRKFGIVSLAMALVFTGGWLRASRMSDCLMVQSASSTHALISTEGCFSWISTTGELSNDGPVTWNSWPGPMILVELVIDVETEWQWRWLGFDFGKKRRRGGMPITFWAIPYWSVAFPLTLFSAYLLLSTSRLSKASNPVEILETASPLKYVT